MAKAILVDTVLCIGCEACNLACREEHDLPGEATEVLSENTYTILELHDDIYVRKFCMHCVDPACASACPVKALVKTEQGAVVYAADRCIGCRYCMVACPFDVPKFEWQKAVPFVKKCDMCEKRVAAGGQTACADACWDNATVFGDRHEMLAEARRRIEANPELYHPDIYGEFEAGGTSVFKLLPKNYTDLNLHDVPQKDLPQLTWDVLKGIPSVVAILGTALTGVWWITNRREDVRKAETEEKAEKRSDNDGGKD